jgi:hypothetical protein
MPIFKNVTNVILNVIINDDVYYVYPKKTISGPDSLSQTPGLELVYNPGDTYIPDTGYPIPPQTKCNFV